MRRQFRISALLLALLLSLSLFFGSCDLSVALGGETEEGILQGEEGKADKPNTDVGGKPTEKPTDTQKQEESENKPEVQEQTAAEIALGVPKYSGTPYATLNGNKAAFTQEELVSVSYEKYSPLDALGRCGVAMACIGQDLMPPSEADRGSISSVKPSGWINKAYDTSLVEGGYIYNRSHMIGWQLSWEDANKQNLITGTRYMNVEGMLPFENMVADYVKETNCHVMYRVTPVYNENDLVACGVIMEAYSVEDNGEEINFNVYIYNLQPGIVIDYATGDSWLASEAPDTQKQTDAKGESKDGGTNENEKTYILNTSTKKIHKPTCSSATSMREENKQEFTGSISELFEQNYSACGICKPD